MNAGIPFILDALQASETIEVQVGYMLLLSTSQSSNAFLCFAPLNFPCMLFLSNFACFSPINVISVL